MDLGSMTHDADDMQILNVDEIEPVEVVPASCDGACRPPRGHADGCTTSPLALDLGRRLGPGAGPRSSALKGGEPRNGSSRSGPP